MRTKQGIITSAKMTGTVTVTVHRSVFHPVYKKRFRSSKKFLADSRGLTDLAVGDLVEIAECRPLSKRKRFKVTDVLKRVPRVSEMAEEAGLEGAMSSKQQLPTENPTSPTKPKSPANDSSSDSSASQLSSASSL